MQETTTILVVAILNIRDSTLWPGSLVSACVHLLYVSLSDNYVMSMQECTCMVIPSPKHMGNRPKGVIHLQCPLLHKANPYQHTILVVAILNIQDSSQCLDCQVCVCVCSCAYITLYNKHLCLH